MNTVRTIAIAGIIFLVLNLAFAETKTISPSLSITDFAMDASFNVSWRASIANGESVSFSDTSVGFPLFGHTQTDSKTLNPFDSTKITFSVYANYGESKVSVGSIAYDGRSGTYSIDDIKSVLSTSAPNMLNVSPATLSISATYSGATSESHSYTYYYLTEANNAHNTGLGIALVIDLGVMGGLATLAYALIDPPLAFVDTSEARSFIAEVKTAGITSASATAIGFLIDTIAPVISLANVTITDQYYASEESNSSTNPCYLQDDSKLDAGLVKLAIDPTPSSGLDQYSVSTPAEKGQVNAATITATDKAGNSTTNTQFYYFIDNVEPDSVTPTALLLQQKNPDAEYSDFCKIKVTWAKTNDAGCGVKYYLVYARKTDKQGNALSNFSLLDTITPTSATQASFESTFDWNFRESKCQVAVVPVDNLGNQYILPTSTTATTYPTSSIYLPKKIEITQILSNLAVSQPAESADMEVDLYLNISAAQRNDYSSIKLRRYTSTDNGAANLPSALLSTYIELDSSKLRIDSALNGSNYIYKDVIPANTGAGHKYLQYSIFETPQNAPAKLEFGGSRVQTLLPNHPGTVSLVFTDMYNRKAIYNREGQKDGHNSNPDFIITADGRVKVNFEGTDIDGDHWVAELDRTKKIYDTPDFISYQKLSGDDPVPYVIDPQKKYIGTDISVTLFYATNTLVLMWNECTNNKQINPVQNQSKFINFKVDPNPINGFTLSIEDEYADYGPDGIVVKPGEPLKMVVSNGENAIPACTWHFGDRNLAGIEYTDDKTTVVHKYHQQLIEADQTEARTTYPLVLNIATVPETTIPVTITVEDTKEGRLFEPEIWRGLHKVTGVVRVPANMQLKIGSPVLGRDMQVEFHSGVGSGNMQGIQVDPQGALIVDNNGYKVNFTKYSNQIDGWGTVVVKNGGTATIKNALFEYADRALTALGGAVVEIFNSVFRLNKTGVHVFGGSTMRINNSTITENTVYGVKEERNASPTLIGNRLFKNFRDFYSWDLGLLKLSELNAKSGNSGNQGE